MPSLNQKLLLRLIAAFVVLGGGVIGLHHVQAGRVPEALLWQADAAAEKGKTDKAIFYLRQYLEFRPDDHDTAVRLGDLMLARAASPKDVQNALFVYERVLREAPQRADVAHKLVTLCTQMRRFADALEHAQRLLATSKDDGELHAKVAQCLAAQGRPDEARTEYERALALAPWLVPAYEQLADLLERHFKKPEDAGVLLDRLTQHNPSRPEAFLARARFLQRGEKLDDCLRALDQALLLDPENGEALVISAEVFQTRGDLSKARATLRDALATYPRYAHGYRALSWLELMGGNEADALTTLERGISVLPDAAELLTPLADLRLDRGNLDRAREVLARLDALHQATPAEGKRPLALRAGYLRGRLLMREGKWNDALAALEAMRADALGMPALNAQVNLLAAACHEHRGEVEAQVEALRRALAADPNHLPARIALANALLNSGRFQDALKEYQTAAKSPFAGLGVRLTFARLRIAIARVSDVPADEWKVIQSFLVQLSEQNPVAAEPAVLRAECLAARGDFVGAEAALRAAIAARPGEVRLWTALADIANRGRGTLAGAEVIGQAQLAAGESVELCLARARVWADDIQPGRERRLAQLEDLAATVGEAERPRLLAGLAEVYGTMHDDAGRARALAALAPLAERDLGCRRALYALALRSGDGGAAARWRSELAAAEGPTGRSAAILDALHRAGTETAVSERDLAGWHDLARGVLAAAPGRADAHLLLAAVAERRRDSAAAARHFDAAADLDPTAVGLQEQRVAYYLRAGQDGAARRALARLESDPRWSPHSVRAIVEGAVRLAGPEALARCTSWLAGHGRHEPRSAVWAGRLLERAGRGSEAVNLYRQATEAFPQFADGWSARLLAASQAGSVELDETIALAGKALDRPAFFAVCAECGPAIRAQLQAWVPPVNTAPDRRAYAEACVSACEARGRLADAVPVLTTLAADKASPSDDAAWARRTLAVLAAALGTADQRREAVNALREGGRTPSTVGEARSRLAALSAALRATTGDDRRVVVGEMIALLAGITKDPAAAPKDWYQLAQLHGLIGEQAAARACLREVNRREPNNLFYLAQTVNDLLADGRLDEARPLAGRLADGVQDLRVLDAACRFHALANEPAAVFTLTERFIRVTDAGTPDGAGRQRQVAELLDRLTRLALERKLPAAVSLMDAACERYRASLRAFPEAVGPMAALIASAGQADKAFEELDRHRTLLSPAAVAAAGVAVVRTGCASPAQVRLVQGWIESALATRPDSLPLRLSLGELLALQGNFAAAEPVYRDVLKADPKSLLALNNLAWILAARPETSAEALGLVERAVALSAVDGEVLDTRARVLIAAGQVDRAVAELTAAVGPGGTLRLFHLALAYERMGKHAEAIRAFRDARAQGLDSRTIHPDDAAIYRALAAEVGGPS